MLDLWARADHILCITVGFLEVRSAIARRLISRPAARARKELNELWKWVELDHVDDQLIALASRVVDVHRLRTLDSLHLAAALKIGAHDLVVATWDAELSRAARARGS